MKLVSLTNQGAATSALRRAVPPLMLCSLLAACGTAGGTAEALPPATANRVVTAADESLLYQALQMLEQLCMSEAGFRMWPLPEPVETAAQLFPYVVDDLGWAREHGFGSDIDRQLERDHTDDPNAAYYATLTTAKKAAATTAFNGPTGAPTGPDRVSVTRPIGGQLSRSAQGCESTSAQRLYGDLAQWFAADTVTRDLGGLRESMAAADPAYAAAVGRWARCMTSAGYHYSSPTQAMTAFSGAASTRPEEIRAAVAEATSAASSGLGATARSLDRTYGDRLAALPRARAILKR